MTKKEKQVAGTIAAVTAAAAAGVVWLVPGEKAENGLVQLNSPMVHSTSSMTQRPGGAMLFLIDLQNLSEQTLKVDAVIVWRDEEGQEWDGGEISLEMAPRATQLQFPIKVPGEIPTGAWRAKLIADIEGDEFSQTLVAETRVIDIL